MELKNKLKPCAVHIHYRVVSEPLATAEATALKVSVPVKTYSHAIDNEDVDNFHAAQEGNTSGSEDWIQELVELPPTEKKNANRGRNDQKIIATEKKIKNQE